MCCMFIRGAHKQLIPPHKGRFAPGSYGCMWYRNLRGRLPYKIPAGPDYYVKSNILDPTFFLARVGGSWSAVAPWFALDKLNSLI